MLKYLIALADELDKCGERKAANAIDRLIKQAQETIPFHETPEDMKKYHDWLKHPTNWINPELVKYVVKNGKEMKDLIYGMSWRNCKLCDGTLTKTPGPDEPLLIEEH